MKAYRFSIAWARIFPEGTGRVNATGLDFYERLVDTLLENGIEPMATLYHWDLPVALDDRGGWLNRDSAEWFAEYAAAVFRRLDGRVKMWSTLNEPWVVSDGGYLHGALAPGHRNRFEAPIASHNLMRAHGRGVQAYRAEGKHRIGLVVNIEPKYAASQEEADVKATARAAAYMNRQYLDPRTTAAIPRSCARSSARPGPLGRRRTWTSSASPPTSSALTTTRATSRGTIRPHGRYARAGSPEARDLHRDAMGGLPARPHRHADVGEGELRQPARLHHGERLRVLRSAGRRGDPVPDPLRTAYLRSHLRAVRDAIDAGCDVRGYFAWSLLDNLEWSLGFTKRFGIVHVDFETQKRTPKESGLLYAKVIASNGAVLDETA
jgi:beta-glucosidase